MCNRNHLVRRRGSVRTAPVVGVSSTLRNFRLGGLAERAKAIPVLRTYDGDTKYQLGNFKPIILSCSVGVFFIVMNMVFGNLAAVELFIKERALFL